MIVPEANDSDKELEQIAKFISSIDRDIPWHISAFHSDYKERDREATPIERLKRAYKIGKDAGFIYSGFGVNLAHKALAKSGARGVVVIGPSHYVAFNGISGSYFDEYETPYGNLKVDIEYLNVMSKHFNIGFIKEAHNKEHSTETQMPFIAKYQPEVKVIKLICSQIDYKELAKVVEWLLYDSLTTVVVGSG